MFCMGGVFEDADKLYESGDYSKAIKMWQRSCDGRDTRSCYRLGNLSIRQERHSKLSKSGGFLSKNLR